MTGKHQISAVLLSLAILFQGCSKASDGAVASQGGKVDYEKAEQVFLKKLSAAREKGDTLSQSRIMRSYAHQLLHSPKKDAGEAIRLIGNTAVDLKQPLTPSDKADLAYAYSLVGMPEESLIWQKAASSAVQAQQNDLARQEDRMKAGSLRRLLAALFVVVLFIIVVNYMRLRKLQADKLLEEEKAESERLMTLAEDLQSKLQSRPSSSGSGIDVLERLCEQYYVYEGTENLQPKILKEVTSLIQGLRQNPRELEDTLNRDHDDLAKRFRTQMHTLKDDDMRLFTYLASGFSSTMISALMEKDKQYVYNRIYRLKGRISSSDVPDKEEFLSMISK